MIAPVLLLVPGAAAPLTASAALLPLLSFFALLLLLRFASALLALSPLSDLAFALVLIFFVPVFVVAASPLDCSAPHLECSAELFEAELLAHFIGLLHLHVHLEHSTTTPLRFTLGFAFTLELVLLFLRDVPSALTLLVSTLALATTPGGAAAPASASLLTWPIRGTAPPLAAASVAACATALAAAAARSKTRTISGRSTSAARICSAVGRSRGSLASNERNRRRSGREYTAGSGGGAVRIIASTTVAMLLPAKGRRRQATSCMTTPSDHTSALPP